MPVPEVPGFQALFRPNIMASQPVRRISLLRRLLHGLSLVVCLGAGFGVAFGIKLLLTKPAVAKEEPEHDEHAEEPTETSNVKRMNLAVRSGNYLTGVQIARHLLSESHGEHAEQTDHPPPADPNVRYAFALCLEGLGRWDEALEAYEKLGEGASTGVKAVAACGEVRCQLAEGHADEATGALVRAERFAAGLPGFHTELDYLRGRLALHAAPKFKPGPFAPDQPMGEAPNLSPSAYADWLALPTSAVGDAVSAPPVASAGEPTAVALAAFNAVLAADPPHPDEAAVRLAVANLRFRAGELDAAGREYKRLRESRPPEPVVVAATYNLGLIRLRGGEWAVARQLFTDAADLGAHTPAAGLAWWWAGRAELDSGNPDACRKAWDRADESDDREMTSAVLLGRAFLALLDGETERAEKLLHGQRVANFDPMPSVRDVFACYLRFADRPTGLNREDLATAVRHAEFGKPFGPAGQLLFGGWLGEAGRGKEMLTAYEAAAETTRGPWAVKLALAIGEQLYATGEKTAAKGRFTAVAASDGGQKGDRARLRLAEIALADGNADECVRLCRQVAARDNEDKTVVLRLLGRGYERLNRPRAAAECFAGRLPTQ